VEFRGRLGDSVSLRIAGYQCPEITDDRWDSNWLLVDLAATVHGRSWTSRDACLLTWEVNWLADWLEAVAKREEADPDCGFLEPDLLIELHERSGDVAHLRVYFESQSRPSWAPCDSADMQDLWAQVSAAPQDLMQAARELREELKSFPVRAGVGESMNRPGP
jgi:hypothetical protein